jgi:hypothetical protein
LGARFVKVLPCNNKSQEIEDRDKMEGSQARFSFQDLWYVATVMQLSTAEASNGAKLGPAPNTNIEDLTIFLVFNFNRRG